MWSVYVCVCVCACVGRLLSLLQALKTNTTLKTLEISHSVCFQRGDKGRLLDALCDHPTLSHISFVSVKGVTDALVTSLFDRMMTNVTIRSLEFHDCNLSEDIRVRSTLNCLRFAVYVFVCVCDVFGGFPLLLVLLVLLVHLVLSFPRAAAVVTACSAFLLRPL